MDTLKRRHKHHLDKRLLFRLRLYFVISVILLGVVLFEIIIGGLTPLLALVGLFVGICIGVIVARMFLVTWDKDAKKVISRLDILGITILVLYIVSAIFRERIIDYFVKASYVAGTSISVVTGIMIGRVFGTGRKIVAILKEQKLF